MMNNRKGVTLTEAVVTLIIVGVLAGGLLTIVGLNARETREGIASSRVQMQYENFLEQISRDVRRAAFVLDTGESFDSATMYPENNSATGILMYNTIGTAIAGYRINNGALFEYDSSSGTYSAYISGSKPVEVTPTSHFVLPQGRKGVTSRVHARYEYKTVTDSIVTNANFIRCRN